MNKIYRIVFNAVTGRWVVASELATGRKKRGGGERGAITAVLVTGALGSLVNVAHAAVVINDNPQEASMSCIRAYDGSGTSWVTDSTYTYCGAPALAGSASGQGDPGADDAIFWSSTRTSNKEDSLNLGGYLDAWKTATFHGGIDMSMQRITNLANGQGDYDAVNVLQLKGAVLSLGGGAAINPITGQVSTPSYTLTNTNAIGGVAAGTTYSNVGSAFTAVDNALGKIQASSMHYYGINDGGTQGSNYANNGATGSNSMAAGVGASATGTNSLAVGNGSYSAITNSTAVGVNAKANTFYDTALGFGATANNNTNVGGTPTGAVALGAQATANQTGAIAIGQGASATSPWNATYQGARPDGSMTNVNFGASIAVGIYSVATNGGLAFGSGATATGQLSDAFGFDATATGTISTAFGYNSTATGQTAIAMGGYSLAGAYHATAIGSRAWASGSEAVAFGSYTVSSGNNSIAFGQSSKASADNAIAFGMTALATGTSSIAMGNLAQATGTSSISIGNGNVVSGNNSGALGDPSTITGANSYSVGNNNTIAANNAFAIGNNISIASGLDGAVVLGNNSTATSAVATPKATIGGKTYTFAGGAPAAGDVVSIGSSSAPRQLQNVAAGQLSSGSLDVVNGSQLYATNQQVTQNTTDIAGNTTAITELTNNIGNGTVGLVQQAAAGENLTVGKDTDGAAVDFTGTAGARKLINVADGTVATGSKEAVNGGQLYGVSQSVASAMGGGSTVNSDGSISAPSYTVTNSDGTTSTVYNAGDAISNLDGRVAQNTTDIAGNTTSINNLQTTVNNISKGTVGLVQQSAAGADLTVGKATDGAAVNFTDMSGKTRTLKGVAIGDVSSTSSEAVNGSQLYATNQAVAQNTMDIDALDTRMGTAEGNITTLDNRVTTNEGDISTIKTDVTKIDGRVTATETNINTLNTNFSTLDRRVTNVEGSVTNITNQLNSGEIGLVQYDDAAGLVTVAKGKAGTAVDFRGSAGARRLKGVAAGGEDEDAVNVSQLKKVADAIGGGATVNADGSITGPTYYVTNADGSKSSVTNMGEAITNLDGRVYNNTTQIQSISTQISSGTIGMVQQAGAGQKLTVGKDTDGTEVDFADNAGNARKLTNVADGTVEAGSKDAVNGGQLQAVSQSMASALGGGSVVNADGTVTTPTYTVTNADGSSSQVDGVEGAISNLDNRVYQNTTAITNNTTAINNLSTQISNGEVGLVKQDAATRQITVAKDSDGTSVSMAGTAGDRVVTGVAAAKADNDAVNLGQLKSAGVIGANGETKSVVTYDNTGKTSITMGGEGATTAVTIHNVADGVADHDAVNISQLNQRLTQNSTEVLVQANGYTDQKIDDVWNGMGQLARQVIKQDRSISQHGAMSMAEAQMTSNAAAAAVGNPNGAWSVGLGMEQGYGAISAGYAKPVGRKSQISFGAAFSGDERSVGMGFAHRL